MFKLANIKESATRIAGRSGLILKKYSPEILIGVGIVGVIGATVLACRATIKAKDEATDLGERIREIKDERERAMDELSVGNRSDAVELVTKDYSKQIAKTYIRGGAKIASLYIPAVTLGVVSITSLLCAHGIMKKRNLALAAAYKAVEQGFADYRRRIVEQFGEETDWKIRNGICPGKEKAAEEMDEPVDTADLRCGKFQPSMYARFFDESSTEWSKTPEYNLTFLKHQQSYANDLLRARGHVFLNEIYDMLGLERSQAGALVGWIRNGDDNYIDFGIFNNTEAIRKFVNGSERNILLDFNVDGPIYNLI